MCVAIIIQCSSCCRIMIFPRHFSKLCFFLRHFSTALFQYHFFPSLFECTFSKPSTFSVHFSKPFSFFKAKMLIDHGYYDFYNPTIFKSKLITSPENFMYASNVHVPSIATVWRRVSMLWRYDFSYISCRFQKN